MRWGYQRNNQRSPKTLLFVFRRFACRPAAFLSVWGSQPEREASLFNLKFLAARVRVYVRQLADGRVFAVIVGMIQNTLSFLRIRDQRPVKPPPLPRARFLPTGCPGPRSVCGSSPFPPPWPPSGRSGGAAPPRRRGTPRGNHNRMNIPGCAGSCLKTKKTAAMV